jgi:hypothetical protein
MVDAVTLVPDKLCDVCGSPRLSEVALQIVEPGVMGVDGGWIGKYSKEKVEKWKAALKAAHERLRKTCLHVWFDCESAHVCEACLKNWVKMFAGVSDGVAV